MEIFYDGTKKCKKCNRDLPNNSFYYPVDKTCKSGLRNVCRECNPKYKYFLQENHRTNEKWSKEDIRLLNDIYANYNNDEIIKLYFPTRTIRAIESIAHKYGFMSKTEETITRGLRNGAKKNPQSQKGKIVSEEAKRNMSVAQKKRYSNHKQRKIASENAIRLGYCVGEKCPVKNNPLYGEKNGRWKGGMSDLSVQLRRDILDWKKSSSEFCGYKCILTGNRFQNIHHLISFDSILQEALKNTGLDKKNKVADYTSEEYESLRNEIITLHSSTLYGACMCKELHELFHKEYTYFNSTIDDFISFVNNLIDGKYNDFLEESNLILNINEKYISYLISNRISTVA